MSVTKTFKNTSDKTVEFKIWKDTNQAPYEYSVAPGEEVEVPQGYAGNFIKRRAPGLTACDELPEPSAQEQAKLDEIAVLAKEAEELRVKKAEEDAELAKLEAEEQAELSEEEAEEEAEEVNPFSGLGK